MATQQVSVRRRAGIQKLLEFWRLVSRQGNQLRMLHSVTASQAEIGVSAL